MAVIVRSVPGSMRKTSSKVRTPSGGWANTPGFEGPQAKYNPRTDKGISQEEWDKGQALAISKEKSNYAPDVVQEQAQTTHVLGPGQFATKEEALAAGEKVTAISPEGEVKKPNNVGDLIKNEIVNPAIFRQAKNAVKLGSDLIQGKKINVGDILKESAVNQGIMVGEAALALGGAWLASLGMGGSAATGIATKAAAKQAAYAAGKEVVAKGLVGSMAGKTILGMSIPKVAGIGLAGATTVMGTDSLANWFMLDNAKTSVALTLNKIESNLGKMSPEERSKAMEAVEEGVRLRDIANAKIETSARWNPMTMALAKSWRTATQATDFQIDLTMQNIKNYNPLMDNFSIESQTAKDKKQLQTYGKPKYDEEGNPL